MDAINIPRIESARAIVGTRALAIRFAGDPAERKVDLVGWIALGGDILAPLADPATFAGARVVLHGAAVEWGDSGGDLAIDAVHLDALADQQRPMTPRDLAEWQDRAGVSNAEAAYFLDISRSTWISYKEDEASVPTRVQMICRAAERDPIILQAHFKPSAPSGRPKQDQGEPKPPTSSSAAALMPKTRKLRLD